MRLPPLRQALINRCTPNPSDSTTPETPSPATITPIRHQTAMKFILLISNAFINTMGITQPSPKAANRAAWFIFIMLSAVLATVVTIAVLALRWASHR